MTRYAQTTPADASTQSSTRRSPLDWVSETVRNKPEALLLLAAGCALLIGAGRSVVSSSPGGGLRRGRAAASDLSSSGAERVHGLRDQVSSMGSQAGSYPSDAAGMAGAVADRAASYAGAISDAASSYAGAASGYAQSAGRGIADRSGRLIDQTQSSLEATLDYLIHEQPLLLGALGLAAGAAIGAALPATDVENRALGEARDHLAQAATLAAADQLSRLKTAAGTVGDKAKEAAAHHGLTPDGLKDMAHEVFEAVKSAAETPNSTQNQDKTSNQSRNEGKPAQQSHGQRDSSGRSPAQGGSQPSGAKPS